MSSPGFPVSLEKKIIDASLNSSMLSLMLLVSRKATRSWIVLGTITLLFIIYVLQISIEWFLIRRSLVDDGETRASTFIATLSSPGWNTLLNDICSLFLSALADGLLIWRCFNVWDRSLRAIALSSILLLSEIAVYLSVIIIASAQKLQPSASAARTLDRLLSAALFTTMASTLLTTLLIAYRIYSVARQDGLKSRKSFRNIVELLIQSAAAYAVVSLLYAIEIVLPFNANLPKIFPLESYTDVIFSFTAGVAPTVMVARVALATGSPIDMTATTTKISGLQFQVHSVGAYEGTSRTDSVHVLDS